MREGATLHLYAFRDMMCGMMGVLYIRDSMEGSVRERYVALRRALGNGKYAGGDTMSGEMGKGHATPPIGGNKAEHGRNFAKTNNPPGRPLGHSGGSAPSSNKTLPPPGDQGITHEKAKKGG